ncbi:fibronectin type III domain-containing protein [uncultured Eubacterium sp.]|uniref:fibronectin type III domain-containing protein n=1 Tax=uncultured Eubacterium sp. TaxID=165185 RepID=UPI0026713CC6|nr:fibronectin type III domain-containing protein [uncultured Eubacterium sp.]
MGKLKKMTALFVVFAVSMSSASSFGITANAFTVQSQYIQYREWYYIEEISDTAVGILEEIAMTDKEMLDDVIERTFNNDFDVKYYIVKTEGTDELYDKYWNSYCASKGDFDLRVNTFEKKYRAKNGNTCYHIVEVNARPMHSPMDWNVRRVERWDEYMDKAKQIEADLGLSAENGNLCGYQKMQLVYGWIKENIKDENFASGRIPVSVSHGQEPIEAILDGGAKCAGYTRTFNRFMYDLNIDSYYVSTTSHAYNLTALDGSYYAIDCQNSNFRCYEGYEDYNKNGKVIWWADGLFIGLGDKTFTTLEQINAIWYYYPGIIKPIESRDTTKGPKAEITLPTCTKDGTFLKEGKEDEHCDYCGKIHQFTLPASHRYTTTEVSYPTCSKEGYRIKKCTECGDTVKEILKKTRHSYKFSARESTYEDEGEFIISCDDCGEVFYDEYMDKLTLPETTTPEPTTEIPTTTEPVTVPQTTPEPTTKAEEPTEEETEPETTTEKTADETTTTGAVVIPETTPETTKKTTEETTKPIREETTAKSKNTVKVKKPGKPKVTAKNKKGKKIKISWKKIGGVKKYRVKVLKGKKVVLSKVLKSRKLTTKKLKKGKTYKIYVRAYNEAGWGKWSKVKKVKIKK